jgi:hypothetical protein
MYVLAAGWWGPVAGVVAVYDTNLVKLEEDGALTSEQRDGE